MSTSETPARPEGPRAQKLFTHLRSQISEGEHPPGERLSIDAGKAEFGVSKQPVMEALRRLETIGLVEIVPQSGCRVRDYSVQEARDFFAVFASFEGDIAAAAALRHDASELAALDRSLERLHAIERAADVPVRSREYFVRNAEFHRTIHVLARSPLLADLSQRLWYLSDFLMYRYAGAPPIAAAIDARNHDHDVIRNAVADRNDVVAKAAMDQHIRSITRLFGDL